MIRDIIEDGIEYLITGLLVILFGIVFISPLILIFFFSPWWGLLILLYPFLIAAAKNLSN